jgi:NitT/TauT family transport system substrate-binding protein
VSRKTKTIAAIALIGGLSLPLAARGDPYPIRIGWVQTPGHMAPIVEALSKKHPELFKHLGQSYAMQPIHFNGTTPQIQAQAIDDLEIASQAPSALALAITNARLDERIVADVVSDGRDGYFSEYFVVMADGPLKTIEDVKGKRIATNTIGSASDAAMRTMFRKHKVQDADFTTVETSFSNMPAMLDGGKVDMIGLLPQFARGYVDNPKYKVLFTARDAVGPTQAVMWAIRAKTIATHRAAFVDFLEDTMRARRWFQDPANHKEAVAICAETTKLPEDALDYVFTKADFYRSPDLVPEIGLVQKEIDESVELKVLPKPVKISPEYVDLSMIEEAKKRLDGK